MPTLKNVYLTRLLVKRALGHLAKGGHLEWRQHCVSINLKCKIALNDQRREEMNSEENAIISKIPMPM